MPSCHPVKTSEYSARDTNIYFMKIPSIAPSLILSLSLAAAGLAHAAAVKLPDGTILRGEFTLKDGKTLKGEVIRMEGETYVIEYQVTPSIKDIKRVPKKDVVKMVIEKPDEKDFLEIANLKATPDLLTDADYKLRMQKVKAFITKYPKSPRAKDAEEILKFLTAEEADVAAGGRKMNGLMVKAPEYRANAYELDARVLEMKIRAAAKNSQWLTALRAFAELDREYQSTTCYRDVLPVVVKALQEFHSRIATILETYDARMEKQAADLEKMPQAERESTQRAIDKENADLEKLYQQEKSSQQPWVTPNEKHKQSLEDDKSLAEAELQRIKTFVPPSTGDGGKIYRNVWKVVHSDADAETMEKAIAEAEAAALPERYLKMLKDVVKESGVKPTEE